MAALFSAEEVIGLQRRKLRRKGMNQCVKEVMMNWGWFKKLKKISKKRK